MRNSRHRRTQGLGRRGKLPLVDRALAKETGAFALKAKLEQLRAAMLIASGDKQKRIDAGQRACQQLAAERAFAAAERLKRRRRDRLKCAPLTTAIKNVESRLAWGERLGVIFSGLSLGSILFLVALGLAITYGLMGVISMAHGELLMIGAYRDVSNARTCSGNTCPARSTTIIAGDSGLVPGAGCRRRRTRTHGDPLVIMAARWRPCSPPGASR